MLNIRLKIFKLIKIHKLRLIKDIQILYGILQTTRNNNSNNYHNSKIIKSSISKIHNINILTHHTLLLLKLTSF